MDLSIFSIGAIHSWLPVSFRSRIAFLRRRTGWYVSGTKSTIRQSWKASISSWCTWCAAQPYLNSRPDDEHVEAPVFMLTHRHHCSDAKYDPACNGYKGLAKMLAARSTPSDLQLHCRRAGAVEFFNKHLPSPRSVLNDEPAYERTWNHEPSAL
jgi:hypothetical protein